MVQTRTPLDGRLALEVALNILQIPQLQALSLQVKWPNDLYSAHGKWGGIWSNHFPNIRLLLA